MGWSLVGVSKLLEIGVSANRSVVVPNISTTFTITFWVGADVEEGVGVVLPVPV